MKLKNIHKEIPVNVTPEKMWTVLSHYGDVSSFHAGVEESYRVEGSIDEAGVGCERVCNIVDMGLQIQLKERITEFEEGKGYRYEVYEWKNFPIQKMFFGFTIQQDIFGKTLLRIDIDYRANPALLTPLMAWKMKRLASDVLLGYKHHTETGENNTPIKLLRRKYKKVMLPAQPQVQVI